MKSILFLLVFGILTGWLSLASDQKGQKTLSYSANVCLQVVNVEKSQQNIIKFAKKRTAISLTGIPLKFN